MERPQFAAIITPADRMGVMLKIRSSGVMVRPTAVPPSDWPDANDLPFFAAALATEAKLIVTLNPRDFAPAATHALRILSPAEAGRELL